MVMNEHTLANPKTLDLFANLSDFSNDLVAQHRRSNVEASNLLDICSADPTRSHLDENITWTYTRNRSILDLHDAWSECKCCFHRNLRNQSSEVAI